MLSFESLALKHTISCFFNSLFREYQDYSYIKNIGFSAPNSQQSIVVHLSSTQDLLIPLTKQSKVGRHEYAGLFFICENSEIKSLNFFVAIDLILDFLCQFWKEDRDKKGIFISRLKNSLHNMETSLQARKEDMQALYDKPVTFKEAEQGLLIGHNFHPYPKMREGFDDKDFSIYSPEMAGHFQLHWFFVRPEVLYSQTAQNFPEKNWTQHLYNSEAGQTVPPGFVAFPVHPWQRQHLLKNALVQSYFQQDLIRDAGSQDNPWYPTSSLRSIYSQKVLIC